MRILLSLIAVAGLVYVPGTCVRRALVDRDAAGSHRLFEEILLGTAVVCWVGFVLAEFRAFGFAAIAAVLALVSIAAASLRRAVPAPYDRTDAVGLALLVVVSLWAAPPFDTLMYGSDSSVYEAGAIHLARTGTLEFIDPTVVALTPAQRQVLLRSQSIDRTSPPYLRLAGGFTIDDVQSLAVLPAFHHLFIVWTALLVSIGGANAAPWALFPFAVVALWAVYRFATDLDGSGTAWLTMLLLIAIAPQYWYSRFPMPEVPAQFFLWAGLGSLVTWQRSSAARDATCAAVGFGLAGLMRTENLLFVALPLLALAAFAAQLPRRNRALFVAVLGLLWLHAGIHLVTFRTHYYGFFEGVLIQAWRRAGALTAAGLVVAGLLVGLGLASWLRRGRVPQSAIVLLAVSAIGIDLAFLVRGRAFDVTTNVGDLAGYVGVPLLAAAVIGAVLMRGRVGLLPLCAMAGLTAAHVLLDPRAQPFPLWVARRFVPVLVPALGILGAGAIARVSRSMGRIAAGTALAACLVLPLRQLIPLTAQPLYPEAARHMESIAALLPADAVILAEKTSVLGTQFLPALWALAGTPAYLVEPDWRAGTAGLVQTLKPRPVYWLGIDTQPPPGLPGITETPIASYEFSFPAAIFNRLRADVTVRTRSRINLYRLAP